MQTKNYFSIYIYGIITLLEGLFLLFAHDIRFDTVIITTGITLTLGSLFAFYASMSNYRKQVQFSYHTLHASAMFAYGIAVVLFSDTIEKFTYITAFLFLFYAFSEVIFCAWLYNLKQKVIFQIMLIRFLLAIGIGIGTVTSLYFHASTFEGFGAIFIMIGLNIVLYVPVMKRKAASEIDLSPE